MPVGEIVKRIFTTDYENAQKVIARTWLDTLEASDKADRDYAQRLLDWYNRDKDEIKKYMQDLAVKTFANEVREQWHFPVINGVPRTIKRLSQAYREPPERELLDAEGEVIPRSKTDMYDQLKRLYEQFDPNSKLKDLDRYGTLLNTVHFEVVPRGKGIDWDIRLRPKVTVLQDPDNYLDFSKFAHYWAAVDPDSETLKKFTGWVYWTEDEHYLIRQDKVFVGMTMPDGSNPYRDGEGAPVIPIVTLRKIEQDDYWGNFGADMVSAMEFANLQLANLYETGLIQTRGIPLLINCGMKSGNVITLGPRDPIAVDNVTKDDIAPDVRFVSPDPDIKEVMDFVDWLVKEIGATYGLPASAWSLEEKRMSGYAKYLDNLELLEGREDEIDMWAAIEADAFEKSRVVYNTWAKQWGAKPIDEELSLKVTFPKTKFPESPKEKAERLAAEFAAGLSSPVDYFMEEEGLDEEAALEKALKIAKHNAEIKRAGPAQALREQFGNGSLPPELTGEE